MTTLKIIRFNLDDFNTAIVELPSGTYIIYNDNIIIMDERHIEEFKELLEDLNYIIL